MRSKRAFTLIELLVVIAIIGLLATLSVLALNNARTKARDAKRLADVKQIQTAMELYFNSTGHYPTSEEFVSGKIEHYSVGTGTTSYMVEIPSAPSPADGDCSNLENAYTYTPNSDLSSYDLSFCVAKSSSDLPDGNLIAFPGGIRGADGGDEISVNCLENQTSCSWSAVGTLPMVSKSFYSDMAIEDGVVYLALTGPQQRAAVLRYNGSSWENVGEQDISDQNVYGISISFNNSIPYIAYRQSDGAYLQRLIVKYFNGTNWVQLGADLYSYTSQFASSDVDLKFDNNIPYVAFGDPTFGSNLRYLSVMKYNGAAWEYVGEPYFNKPSSGGTLGFYGGQPYVGFSGTDGNGSLAYYNGSSWAGLGTVVVSEDVADFVSLIMSGGTPYIAFTDYAVDGIGKISVMSYNGLSWEYVGPPRFTDDYSEVQDFIIKDSQLYLVFGDYSETCDWSGNLSLARYNGSDWEYVGGRCFSTTAALMSSLAFSDNTPYVLISNSNVTASVLKFSEN